MCAAHLDVCGSVKLSLSQHQTKPFRSSIFMVWDSWVSYSPVPPAEVSAPAAAPSYQKEGFKGPDGSLTISGHTFETLMSVGGKENDTKEEKGNLDEK